MKKRIKPSHSPNFLLIQWALLCGAVACSSLPVQKPEPTEAEQIRTLPREQQNHLESILLQGHLRKPDPEVENYLAEIATRLEKPDAPIQVLMIQGRDSPSAPTLRALPPDRLLIDVQLLKRLQFENEIAAAIALSWELTRTVSFQKRYLSEVRQATPNVAWIYDASPEERHVAMDQAIARLYEAQYDPRGMVSFLDKLEKLHQNHKMRESWMKDSQDIARRTISYYPPLLNPVIRTQAFYRIRQRIERL